MISYVYIAEATAQVITDMEYFFENKLNLEK